MSHVHGLVQVTHTETCTLRKSNLISITGHKSKRSKKNKTDKKNEKSCIHPGRRLSSDDIFIKNLK